MLRKNMDKLLQHGSLNPPVGLDKDVYMYFLKIDGKLNTIKTAPVMKLMWGRSCGGNTYTVKSNKSLSNNEASHLLRIVFDSGYNFPIGRKKEEDHTNSYVIWHVNGGDFPGISPEITRILTANSSQLPKECKKKFSVHTRSKKNRSLLGFIGKEL